MSNKPSRLVGAMWWVLIVTPAISLAIQISNGYLAQSPDEAGGGLGPDDLLILLALLLALAILARLVFRWGRTARWGRIEALAAALAVIPFVVALFGMRELVGWPHTRTASARQFGAAALIVLGWTGIAVFARHRLRVQALESKMVSPGSPPSASRS